MRKGQLLDLQSGHGVSHHVPAALLLIGHSGPGTRMLALYSTLLMLGGLEILFQGDEGAVVGHQQAKALAGLLSCTQGHQLADSPCFAVALCRICSTPADPHGYLLKPSASEHAALVPDPGKPYVYCSELPS